MSKDSSPPVSPLILWNNTHDSITNEKRTLTNHIVTVHSISKMNQGHTHTTTRYLPNVKPTVLKVRSDQLARTLEGVKIWFWFQQNNGPIIADGWKLPADHDITTLGAQIVEGNGVSTRRQVGKRVARVVRHVVDNVGSRRQGSLIGELKKQGITD
jgi:hypothetical protein